MAAFFGLVMDIGGLWLRTSFIGEDKDAQVAETHDRVLGTVYDGEDRDANVVLSNVGLHIPKSLGVPRHNNRSGVKKNLKLTQVVSREKVKKFFIRGMHGGTLELWYGEVDVAAKATYGGGADDLFAYADRAEADNIWNADQS
jgi:hypothetical protein